MPHIYIIKNSINDKVYIGQTKNSLEYRFSRHKTRIKDKNQNSALYAAFRKYGIENFWIESIEEGDFSKEELNEKEIYYIQKFNSVSPNGYNMQYGGNCSNVSDETKEKMREIMKGREVIWGDKISKTMKEKWKDENYRSHMSQAHRHPIGKYKKHTKPLRKDLPIDEINSLYNSGMSINQIAKKFNVPHSTIKRRIDYGN